MSMEQDGGWKSARKSIDKGLLKNIIRHTDAHNKIQEQNEMWKHWELKKQSRRQDHSHKHESRTSGYMRSDIGLSSAAKKESLKWNRLLVEYEETRNDRWGHSGYKELYPDEFLHANTSDIESDESETKGKVKIDNETFSRKKKKSKKEKSKNSRKIKSDSSDNVVKAERNHKTTTTRSEDRDNYLKTRNRKRDSKMELNEYSKLNPLKPEKVKTESKYVDDDLSPHDRKRKTKSDSGVKNGRRDRKRKSEISDVNIERIDGKRNTDSTSRKYSRAVENSHSSKKEKKIKH